MKEPEIEGVDIGNVDIHVEGLVEVGQIDIGSVQLENNGRKFALDVTSYHADGDKDWSIISCDIEVDTDTFPVDEYKYDLTKDDLLDMNHGGTGTLYVTASEETEPFEVTAIQLWFTANGEYQYISLEEEK